MLSVPSEWRTATKHRVIGVMDFAGLVISVVPSVFDGGDVTPAVTTLSTDISTGVTNNLLTMGLAGISGGAGLRLAPHPKPVSANAAIKAHRALKAAASVRILSV